MEMTPVDRLYEESKAAVVSLELNEPSLASAASDNFRKALLLASASYFESLLATIVVEYVHEVSSGSVKLVSFTKNKAISRQYHSWGLIGMQLMQISFSHYLGPNSKD
jgi:hypothetical protein